MIGFLRLAFLAACCAAVLPARAHAHAISGTCQFRGGQIEVQAYYEDDAPAQNARVVVFDGQRKELAQGRTDKTGRWLAAAPPAGKYEVLIDAGAGHRVTLKITIPGTSSEKPDDATQREDPPTAQVLSDGPSREEFTQIPWISLGAGLALIALFAVASRVLLRQNTPHR